MELKTLSTNYEGTNINIEKLMSDVYHELEDPMQESKLSSSVTLLRRICGANRCGCLNLTASQTMNCLLKLLRKSAVTEYSVGISIMDNYSTLGYERHCQIFLERMLVHALRVPSSERRSQFLDQLWEYPGLIQFKVEVLESFLLTESHFIEEDCFKMFEEMLVKDELCEVFWSDWKCERMLRWCCYSARVFSVVTSVLNSWMLRIVSATRQYEACLTVVSQFVQNVRQKCAESNRDFVLLYPRELHGLVSFLDIKPSLLPKLCTHETSPTHSTVLDYISDKLKTKQVETLCLLTHFPEWIPYLEIHNVRK